MSDMSAFERRVADEMLYRAGPTRPIDDIAVVDAVIAADRSHRWGFTMFSALKTVAAAAVVALFGAFLLGGFIGTEPADPVIPAAVTESPTPESSNDSNGETVLITVLIDGVMPFPEPYLAGDEPVLQGSRLATRGEGFEVEIEDVSDPRLAGTYRNIVNLDTFPIGEVWSSSSRIDNEDGSWLGHFTGFRDPREGSWSHQGILTGSGSYEGLSAVIFLEGVHDMDSVAAGELTYQVRGMVFPGELPDFPEYPEPAE